MSKRSGSLSFREVGLPSHDPELRQVAALGASCAWNPRHALHVARLALQLFDELKPIHRLDMRARMALWQAALLHDIGWIGGKRGHHRRARKLIRRSPELNWTPEWRDVVGQIARYHRRAHPALTHAPFAALEPELRDVVAGGAALLRIADGLDYSHREAVRSVTCECTSTAVTIRVHSAEPVQDELGRADRKAQFARKFWERDILFTWHPSPPLHKAPMSRSSISAPTPADS